MRPHAPNNKSQGIAPNPDLHRGRGDVLTIGENFSRRIGVQAHPRRPEIFDLSHADVPATIDHSK